MATSKLTISIYVLFSTIVFVVQMGAAADDPLQQPITIDCAPTHFPGKSNSYNKNLNILLNNLLNKTAETGSAVGFVGDPRTGLHGVYGRALCRRDFASPNCKTCFAASVSKILKECPLSTSAYSSSIVCTMTYLDKSSFRKEKFEAYGVEGADNLISFAPVETITEFVGNLTEKAVETKTFFAKGEVKVADDHDLILYGLVQCALDLSPSDCRKCIAQHIPDLAPTGRRIGNAVCTVQYQFYPFFN